MYSVQTSPGGADDRYVDSPGINPWAILDTLPEYIAVVDMGGTIQYLNAAWYQLILERSVGDIGFTVGGHYLTSFQATFGRGGADVQTMEEGLYAVLDGRRDQWVCEYPYDQAGEKRWFTTTIIPTYMVNGSRGALIRQMDTTTTKQTEERLRHQNTALEAVRSTAKRFLKSPDLNRPMEMVLEHLSQATGLSRDYTVADVVAAAACYHHLEQSPACSDAPPHQLPLMGAEMGTSICASSTTSGTPRQAPGLKLKWVGARSELHFSPKPGQERPVGNESNRKIER
ncbi:MAG: PAS domain-containing protein [Chloroflexaceae bacterium]|nr:PAS domain-containing protein [Chloroflexaceae bacterium]